MKHVINHNRAFRLAALTALTALVGGLATLTPANAQDGRDFRDRRDRQDHQIARYDAVTLRREQDHLHDLQTRRRDAARHHDYDRVHRLDAAIRDTQWRISNKRFDVAHDYDSFYGDRDREFFRSHYH